MSGDTAITDDTVQLPCTSGDRFSMDSSHPFLSVESYAVQEVVKRFHAWNLNGGSTATSQSPSTSASESASASTSQTQTQQQEKRRNPHKRPAGDGDEPGENGGDRPPPKKQSRKRVPPGHPRLACHFQKRYPDRNPTCGSYTLISHVKQHLRKKHKRSPYYCPRCNVEFTTEEERDDHIELMVSSPCRKRVYDASTQISARVAKQLEKGVESASKLHEQWFSVWDTIFPGILRPVTCTYDICSELPVQVLGLYSYLETEGPGTVISVLQHHGLSINPEESRQHMPSDLETFVRRVLFQACREIYQNWQSQREQDRSSNWSPIDPSNTSPEKLIHITVDGNMNGGSRTSVEQSPKYKTNDAMCTPTSSSKRDRSAMDPPVETSPGPGPGASGSGTQRQPDHGSPRTPVSMPDGGGNEDGLPWHADTALDDVTAFDGYMPQGGAPGTLQYPFKDGHMADAIFDFDLAALSTPKDFNFGQ